MVVNKIWSYGDPTTKVEVYDVNATTMGFRIKNHKVREKIIKRGMWNIAGVPMIVKKWTPKTEEEKQEEEAIPMWVHLRKVPLHMFSWEALSFMTSTVGFPVHLHPETIACSNFDEAKIFVNVDVSKTLPKEIDFVIDGKEFTAEFYYPLLPSRCSLCEKWGHTDKVCVLKKKEKKLGEQGVAEGSGSKDRSKPKENPGVGDLNTEERLEKGELGTSATKVNNSEFNKDVMVMGVTEKKGTAWSLISPKEGRTQTPLRRQEMEVQILASKYAILSLDDKEEGEIQAEE
ncbi:hypothetical protein YC2023_081779 [Brassica napus]